MPHLHWAQELETEAKAALAALAANKTNILDMGKLLATMVLASVAVKAVKKEMDPETIKAQLAACTRFVVGILKISIETLQQPLRSRIEELPQTTTTTTATTTSASSSAPAAASGQQAKSSTISGARPLKKIRKGTT